MNTKFFVVGAIAAALVAGRQWRRRQQQHALQHKRRRRPRSDRAKPLLCRSVVRTSVERVGFELDVSRLLKKVPVLKGNSKPYLQVKVQSFRERGAPESGFGN